MNNFEFQKLMNATPENNFEDPTLKKTSLSNKEETSKPKQAMSKELKPTSEEFFKARGNTAEIIEQK